MKAFLFAGQGAQAPGMGKDIYDLSESARMIFRKADEVIGRKISEICFDGTEEDLSLTINTQPCMLAVELAIHAVLKENGFIPDIAAGFSLGEYAALTAAGVISEEDAFRLIDVRARAMTEALPAGAGAMAAVKKCSEDIISEVCSSIGNVWPVNFNSPQQIVISGLKESVSEAQSELKSRKFRSVILPVSTAFHTPLMEPAKKVLEKTLNDISFNNASIPVYMNVDGRYHLDSEDIKEKLLLQTVSPVRWVDTLTNIQNDNAPDYFEIGPGTTLSAFVSKTLDRSTQSIADKEGIKAVCCHE